MEGNSMPHTGVIRGRRSLSRTAAPKDSEDTNGTATTGGSMENKSSLQNGHAIHPPVTKPGWRVIHQLSLPHFLRDNEYLINFHRPQLLSVQQCLSSVFRIHTETGNIWTHLLGFVGTLALAFYYVCAIATDWDSRWSHSIFFMGAMTCLAGSTVYHTFLCYSEPVNRQLAKLDYCGIIVLIVASFAPWVHFGFYCDLKIKMVYLVAICLLGALSIAVVIQDKFRTPRYRPLRAGLFIALGLTGVFPGVHYIFTAGVYEAFRIYFWLLFMACLYIFGGVIYAVRIPERLSPGSFDIWFQSHQVLHVCVLGGVLSCYHGTALLAHHTLEVQDVQCPINM